jgi:hypothetical protein
MKSKIDALLQVRVGFLKQGTTFHKWCQENNITRQWATAALTGRRNGPAAKTLRERIIRAATPEKEAA